MGFLIILRGINFDTSKICFIFIDIKHIMEKVKSNSNAKRIRWLACGLLLLIIIGILFPFDYYKHGIEEYGKGNYEKALDYFKKVQPDNIKYSDALIKIKILQNYADSVSICEHDIKGDSVKREIAVTKEIPLKALDLIPGLSPVDVYGNLENQGFEVNKDIGTDGCFWTCTKYDALIGQYSVRVYGDTPLTVKDVQASYTNFSEEDTDEAANEFLGYISTLPFKGSIPDEAKAWVKTNIGKNGLIQYGGVNFELFGKGKNRILRIYAGK
jgi:hypothetical protein